MKQEPNERKQETDGGKRGDKKQMTKHNIDPVYDGNSEVLILGSFPSPKSREQGFFYGHPQNRMWKVLSAVFEEPVPLTIEEKKAFLLRNHIAMWDVLSECEVTGASDTSIKEETPNCLAPILETGDIRAIFTTGAAAAKFYKKYDAEKYDIPHFQLKSTSPANAAAKLPELIENYRCLRDILQK